MQRRVRHADLVGQRPDDVVFSDVHERERELALADHRQLDASLRLVLRWRRPQSLVINRDSPLAEPSRMPRKPSQ